MHFNIVAFITTKFDMLADGFPGEFLRYLKKKKRFILLQAPQEVGNPPKRVLACWSKTISLAYGYLLFSVELRS
jgi:hypothetical protein